MGVIFPALAGVGCASFEVEWTRPLDDSEKTEIEHRAERHQNELEVNIDKERDR